MFTKLLAYEIRSRYRTDARSFWAFIAVIAIASGIVAVGLPGISGSTAVLAYALCALTPLACVIASLADYWRTLYGQRGYFTMSLPVSGKVIFWAKNTRMVIECLLALVLAVGGIVAIASAAAWSEGMSLAEYTAGPRSLVAGMPTSTVVLMIAAQLILAMSWACRSAPSCPLVLKGASTTSDSVPPSSVSCWCTSSIRCLQRLARSSSRCPSRLMDTSAPRSCGPRSRRRWVRMRSQTSSVWVPTSSCLCSRWPWACGPLARSRSTRPCASIARPRAYASQA